MSKRLKVQKVVKNRRRSNQRNKLRTKNKLNKKAIRKVNQRLLLKAKNSLQKPSKKKSRIPKNLPVNNQNKQMNRQRIPQKIRNRWKILRILTMSRNNWILKKMSKNHKTRKAKVKMVISN